MNSLPNKLKDLLLINTCVYSLDQIIAFTSSHRILSALRGTVQLKTFKGWARHGASSILFPWRASEFEHAPTRIHTGTKCAQSFWFESILPEVSEMNRAPNLNLTRCCDTAAASTISNNKRNFLDGLLISLCAIAFFSCISRSQISPVYCHMSRSGASKRILSVLLDSLGVKLSMSITWFSAKYS